MSDEFWGNVVAACVNAVAIAFAAWFAPRSALKRYAHEKKMDWNQKQAEDFLRCSISFSQTISNIVTDISIWSTKDKSLKDESLKEKCKGEIGEKVTGYTSEMRKLDWDIKRYAQEAKKTKDSFLKKEQELFDLTWKLYLFFKNPESDPFDLESVRKVQNEFDSLTRSVHSELCGIKT